MSEGVEEVLEDGDHITDQQEGPITAEEVHAPVTIDTSKEDEKVLLFFLSIAYRLKQQVCLPLHNCGDICFLLGTVGSVHIRFE